MRVCIIGLGGLHKSANLHLPGSTRPAGMSRRQQVRLEEIVMSGIGKMEHLCSPVEVVMHAFIYASGQFLNGTYIKYLSLNFLNTLYS